MSHGVEVPQVIQLGLHLGFCSPSGGVPLPMTVMCLCGCIYGKVQGYVPDGCAPTSKEAQPTLLPFSPPAHEAGESGLQMHILSNGAQSLPDEASELPKGDKA